MNRDPRPADVDRFREIAIHDRLGADKERPRAEVTDGHGSWAVVDIYATVRNNAASIGHPVIRRAIEKWERDAKARYLVQNGNALAERAENHLEGLCAALLDGVRRRVTSPQTRLVYAEAALRGECDYLKAAWEIMKEDKTIAVKRRDGSKSAQLISLIEVELIRVKKGPGYEIDQIMDYLRSDKGARFLGARKSWDATKSMYLAWRLKTPASVARTYRHRSKGKKDWPAPSFLEAGDPHFFFPTASETENLSLVYIADKEA